MAGRSTGRSGGRRLVLALLVLWQSCPPARASEALQNRTDSNDSATIATYSVEDEGSTCSFMSSIGTGILLSITRSAEDASVLEEAAQNPNSGAVKELVTYHQQGVNVFFIVIWGVIIFFSIFMIAAIIHFLYIMCTGEFKHHAKKSNMGVYIFCVISVTALLLVMVVLLVCLIGCRGAIVGSTTENVPVVYSSTFDNLRKFVRVTAMESNRVDDRGPQAMRVLAGGFHRAFGAFLARSARTDDRAPLFRLASHCDRSARLRTAHAAGDAVGLPDEKDALAQQCARLRRSQQELFDKMTITVEASTTEYRRELAELLSDLSFLTDASDGSSVLSSVESIDRLQRSVDEYESNKGSFAALAKDAYNDFFWVNILLLVCLIALVVTLLMGVAIHDKTAKPTYRSKLSHIIGFLFVITAFLFGIFVIIAIFTTMYLTIVSALGYCYLCEPYMNEKYYVLDDALERLWPSNNRSLLLSKITPSKVMGDCVNDSIASLVLNPKLIHRKYVERNFYHNPAQRLRMEYELHNNPLNSHRDSFISSVDDSFPFDEIGCISNASTSLQEQSIRTCRSEIGKNMGKLAALGVTDVRSYRDIAEKALLRVVPFYFGHFVEQVVDSVQSSATAGGGRCSTLRSILSSFMDVVCYTYVLELVSYWASLMLATFAAILVIPFCFVLSKYFFRTKRKKFKKRRDREVEESSYKKHRVREVDESSSLAEPPSQANTSSGYSISVSFTPQEEPTTEVTRRVVYQSRSSRIYDPFAQIYAPAIRRQASFTSILSRIPLQHIRRIHSVASHAPPPIAYSRSMICHHHDSPPTVVAAPVHNPLCITSVPPAPMVVHCPRSTRVVHHVHSHTTVAPRQRHRHSRTAVMSTNRHVAPSPSVVCVSSPPTVLAQPPTALTTPSRVVTRSTTVLTQQPAVVTQQPTVLTTPQTVLTPPPTVVASPPTVLTPPLSTVPLVAPPPAQPAITSPVGSGPAENQQAATAHMTINFYGNPAGGAFTMPMTGYPVGYPTTGYVAAAGQPYYCAAPAAATVAAGAPVAYATAVPAATTTVTAGQPVSFATPTCQAAAPAYQYAYAVPQQQSVSTRSVSTRSTCSRPSSPVVTRVPAATKVSAQPACTQLYAVPPQ